jgi:hypothetical protein
MRSQLLNKLNNHLKPNALIALFVHRGQNKHELLEQVGNAPSRLFPLFIIVRNAVRK